MLNKTLAVAVFFGLSTVAFANTQSDTVPTSQLLAYYGVSVATGTSNVALSVSFYSATVAAGQLTETALDQSTDDVVTFSEGSSSVTYDPVHAASNVLPFVPGATYSVSFKRATGETFTSTIPMPGLATITQPSDGQAFNKTDAVTINWTAPASAQPALFAVGANCSAVQGDITYNSTYTSTTIPAGYAAGCTGAVQMEFQAFYVGVGTGYGSAEGVSVTSVQFSYGATLPPLATAPHRAELLKRAFATIRGHRPVTVVKYLF